VYRVVAEQDCHLLGRSHGRLAGRASGRAGREGSRDDGEERESQATGDPAANSRQHNAKPGLAW
jgi:hypothetical protein